MTIEHIGITVSDPLKMADWYVANLGCKELHRDVDDKHRAVFLADGEGTTVLELIWQTGVKATSALLDNTSQLHLAFTSADPAADRARLEKAGAAFVSEMKGAHEGEILTMLRDPWGNCIQLVRRGEGLHLKG